MPICIERLLNETANSRVYVVYGLPRPRAVARHDRHGDGGLARRVTLGAQARGGLLVLPGEQRAVGGLGHPRPRLGAGGAAVLPGDPEYPRRLQERVKQRLRRLLGGVQADERREAAQPGLLALGQLPWRRERARAHFRFADLAVPEDPQLGRAAGREAW